VANGARSLGQRLVRQRGGIDIVEWHSLAVDPWGTFLVDAPNQEGVVVADLDFDYMKKIRTEVPSLANRRPSAYERQAAKV
jgi:predicted amidohydrolase